MSKFMIGDRVQVNGKPTDWDIGTVECVTKPGENGCSVYIADVKFDSSGQNSYSEHNLFLVHRPTGSTATAIKLIPGYEPTGSLADWEKAVLEPASNIPFAEQVDNILDSVGRLLKAKNEAYGDSALNPVRIFSKADPADGLRVRIDDKLSRIARGADAGEDTVTDLLGYLVLLKISEGNK